MSKEKCKEEFVRQYDMQCCSGSTRNIRDKNMMSNNPKAAIPEDATSGKTNICKKVKIMNSDKNYASVYLSNMESSRIINSYHIHVLSNV